MIRIPYRQIVHKVAEAGFGESNVLKYNSGRPSYSIEVTNYVKGIIDQCHENRSIDKILELGAGTGKFTESFITSKSMSNFDRNKYVATDPSAPFLKNLQEKMIGVQTKIASGSNIPLESNSCSAVVIAQAFHWMSSKETLNEIHRVLNNNPKGPLILIWNSLNRSKADWIRQLEEVILEKYYVGDRTPRFIDGLWENCFFEETGLQLFKPLRKWKTEFTVVSTSQQIVDRITSVSVISRLPQEDIDRVADEVKNLLKNHPETYHILNDQYPLHYITDVCWTITR